MAKLGEGDWEPVSGSSLSPHLELAYEELYQALDEEDSSEKDYHIRMALQYIAVLSDQTE